MRKLLILGALTFMMFASVDSAEAARRNRGYTRSRSTWNTNRSGGIFARLMELERRKNAIIFGR